MTFRHPQTGRYMPTPAPYTVIRADGEARACPWFLGAELEDDLPTVREQLRAWWESVRKGSGL